MHWCLASQWLLAKALRNEEEQEVRYSTDPFLKDNGFTWDFIFVFKVCPHSQYCQVHVFYAVLLNRRFIYARRYAFRCVSQAAATGVLGVRGGREAECVPAREHAQEDHPKAQQV